MTNKTALAEFSSYSISSSFCISAVMGPCPITTLFSPWDPRCSFIYKVAYNLFAIQPLWIHWVPSLISFKSQIHLQLSPLLRDLLAIFQDSKFLQTSKNWGGAIGKLITGGKEGLHLVSILASSLMAWMHVKIACWKSPTAILHCLCLPLSHF